VKDRLQLRRPQFPHLLIHPALFRRLVRAPAQEARRVAEAVAGHLVVLHLGDQIPAQRLPLRRAFCRPAARPAGRVAGEARRFDQRLQPLDQLGLVAGGRAEADMVELAVIPEQPEQQRADFALARGIAEAAHHAVGGPDLLDLQHRALARPVRLVQPLGDDTVQGAARAREPAARLLARSGCRRQQQGGRAMGRMEPLQRGAALRQRSRRQQVAVGGEQVEEHILRGRLRRQLADPAFRRMQAKLERLEGQAVAHRDDQLAIEHEAVRLRVRQHRHHLRKVAAERLARLGDEPDVVALPHGDAAEPVPFRLELPPAAVGQSVHQLCFHRRDRLHPATTPQRGLVPKASTVS
jgi:hypothetical protein